MKKSKKVIIGIVVFLVFCGAMGSLSEKEEDVAKVNINETVDASDLKSDSDTDVVDTSNTDTTATDDTKENKDDTKEDDTAKTDSKEESKDTEEKDDLFVVGEMAVTKEANISFLDCGDYEEPNEYLQPKDGMKYIYFQFEFENTSKNDYYVGTFDCYADGYVCDSYYGGEDTGVELNSISSGRKTKGTIYYEVPEDAKEIQLEYSNSLWSNKKITFQFN